MKTKRSFVIRGPNVNFQFNSPLAIITAAVSNLAILSELNAIPMLLALDTVKFQVAQPPVRVLKLVL